MDKIDKILDQYFHKNIYKIILSNPVAKDEDVKKIIINRLPDYLQIEKYSGNQVFHENIQEEDARKFISESLGTTYRQYNAWDNSHEFSIRINKKGKILFKKEARLEKPKIKLEHNRIKSYLLEEGTTIPPLIDMGIFTAEGKVINSMYDKYKQINRFVEVIDDELKNWDPDKLLTVIDFGCGKSYLTFILYHYFVKIKNYKVKMIGLDLKSDVIKNCNEAATKYGYENLIFELGDIDGYKGTSQVDLVISLHACDTATDYALYNAIYALYNAINWDAQYIFSVPCCQHELNQQIKSEDLAIITRYGIIQERFSALMTDAIRANLLTSCGYKTQVLEFVDLSHTPKNLLIRAVRTQLPNRVKKLALNEVNSLCKEFNLDPLLKKLLKDNPNLKNLL